MAPRRKLFLTHAGELAHRLAGAIGRDGMALEFVRGYAERHDRAKVVANVVRLREMESTISREALLLIAGDVRRLLPRAFGLPRNPHAEDLALCELFYNEFLEAVGRALGWAMTDEGAEAAAFRRDLEIYARWSDRNPPRPGTKRSSGDDSPFPDRCAILLDPAMMEQARRAAAKFQLDLLRLGARVFGQLGCLPSRRRVSPGSKAGTGRRGRRAGPRETDKKLQPAGKSAKKANRPRSRRGELA